MEKDLRKKKYLYDTERFADLINGTVCQGKQIISAKDLSDMDSQTGGFKSESVNGRTGKKQNQRYRDLVKKATVGMNFVVIGIENQEEVHYLMPLRCMTYDAGEYERQATNIQKKVRKQKGLSSAEFLSGFTKKDKLKPCITLVLYYGKNWDGAKDIYSLLDFSDVPEELRGAVSNYQIHICEVRKFQNTDVFMTDLKQVFDCIRYSDDKEKLYELVMNDPAYKEMDEDTYDVIAEYTSTEQLMEVKQYKEKGKVDMCKAIEEMIQDGRMEGLNQGLEQGIKQGMGQGLERGIQALIETCKELGLSKADTLNKVESKFKLEKEILENYLETFWNAGN